MKKLISFVLTVGCLALLFLPACRKNEPARPFPVNPVSNHAPVAIAGIPQQITLSSCQSKNGVAELDASASYDPDGQIRSYDWAFISGPQVPNIINSHTPKARLEDLAVGLYGIQLKVTDNKGVTTADTVLIHVISSPAEIDLELSLQVSYQYKDSVFGCYYYNYNCSNQKTTTMEGKVQHPSLGLLDIHISEEATIGSYYSKRTIVNIYKRNINEQFISGSANIRLHEVFDNGYPGFTGHITLTYGSAIMCDPFFFLNNQVKLSMTGLVDQNTKTISLRITGKAYF